MEKTDLCPVCKGTGRECHKYIRDDGEHAVEEIRCEPCNGTGRVKKEPNFYEETRFIESTFNSHDTVFGGFNTYEEDNQ